MNKTDLNRSYFEAGDWLHTQYRGVSIFKYTTDLYVYEQILRDTNPDLIIETGTLKGGSALWFRDHSKAHIITMDLVPVQQQHLGIKYLVGDSLDKRISVKGYERVMVVLDSDHSKDHVASEIIKYAPLVSKGCYLVVEDTFISQYLHNDDPNNDYQDGSSWEAVQKWDKKDFESVDLSMTLSMNPGGWFKRV